MRAGVCAYAMLSSDQLLYQRVRLLLGASKQSYTYTSHRSVKLSFQPVTKRHAPGEMIGDTHIQKSRPSQRLSRTRRNRLFESRRADRQEAAPSAANRFVNARKQPRHRLFYDRTSPARLVSAAKCGVIRSRLPSVADASRTTFIVRGWRPRSEDFRRPARPCRILLLAANRRRRPHATTRRRRRASTMHRIKFALNCCEPSRWP